MSTVSRYAGHVAPTAIPQTEAASPKQELNNAGGYSFVVDDWARLERFLVLGSEGGTYYVGERKLTKDNAGCVQRCLDLDGVRAVEMIASVSESGRAPKNDAAIFALALAAAHSRPEVQAAALAKLQTVCRIGTHLFSFCAAVDQLRGWGRGLRRAVAKWYTDKPAERLAYQVLKYQQRNGWSHRDLLRLSHAAPSSDAHAAVFRWIAAQGDLAALGAREVVRRKKDKTEARVAYPPVSGLPEMLSVYDALKSATDSSSVIRLVTDHGFVHEMIPTEFKNDPAVWDALLQHMPITAMVRSLAKMTSVGLLAPLSDASKLVASRLTDEALLKKGRVHPMSLLLALGTYSSGEGLRGKLTWEPLQPICDALNDGFHLAFSTVVPTGQNIMIALDVSASMGWTACGPISCAQAAAALCMVTARTEQNWHILAFADSLRELPISPKMRLDDVLRVTEDHTFGGTDCSLPMVEATKRKLDVDAFYVFTDNETWAGKVHPHIALQEYRSKRGRPHAKLVVVAMDATEFSIANPDDGGMLDVVGMDAAAPQVIADFTRGGVSK